MIVAGATALDASTDSGNAPRKPTEGASVVASTRRVLGCGRGGGGLGVVVEVVVGGGGGRYGVVDGVGGGLYVVVDGGR